MLQAENTQWIWQDEDIARSVAELIGDTLDFDFDFERANERSTLSYLSMLAETRTLCLQ